MPEVLVISDSHGLTEQLMEVKTRHGDVDAMIHCGDSELASDSEELRGFYYAKGNCDFDPEMQEEQVVDVDGVRFFVGHGHLLQVKQTLMPIFYRAEETGADIACFGHSHMLGVEKVGGKLVMNPGSSHLPRDREEPTYAIIKWTQGTRIFTVSYFHTDGTPLEDLRTTMDLGEKM